MGSTVDYIFAQAAEMIASYLGCPKQGFTRDTDLVAEYFLDSLDLVDIGIQIERTFAVELTDDASSRIRTMEDIVLLVLSAKAYSSAPHEV